MPLHINNLNNLNKISFNATFIIKCSVLFLIQNLSHTTQAFYIQTYKSKSESSLFSYSIYTISFYIRSTDCNRADKNKQQSLLFLKTWI